MKKKFKILGILFLTIFFIIIYKSNVKAASASVSANKTSITLGETVTITTTINGASWDISLSGAVTQGYADTTDDAENGTKTYTASFTPSSAGKYTVSLSGNVTDSNDSRVSVSDQVTINVSQASSGGSSSSSGSTAGSSTTSEPEEESSNANLSNLGIRPNDFSGFKPGTTTYNATVPEDVETVEVYATAQDSGATISGTGNQTLAYGENALNVVVTAEDGTIKTYTINVTREGEGETEEGEDTETVSGLSNITIGNSELTPSFKTDVYEYTVKYIGEDTSLGIQTVATDPSYTVEILGNEELKEGENIITILVADSEGNNVATYQLTVNKSLVDEEALAREEQERQQQEQRKMFMIAGGIILLILIIVIIIVIKRRRNRAYAEEFSGVPFAGMNDEDADEYDNDYDNYNNYDNDNQFDNYHDEPENEQNAFLQKDNNEDLSIGETEQEDNQETNKNLDFDDSEEKREKERAKRDFLAGYNTDYTDEYEEEKPRRGRKKGKRFK